MRRILHVVKKMYRERVPDDVFHDIVLQMEEAEMGGVFREMFKGEFRRPEEDERSYRHFYESLTPGMKLYHSTFKKIIGYDINWPGRADTALERLTILGCSKARGYYACIKAEWQHQHEQEMKRVAAWYRKQDFERKEVSETRKQQEAEQLRMQKLPLLKQKLQLLKQKKAEEEQSVTRAEADH